jgi:hypothetical protein
MDRTDRQREVTRTIRWAARVWSIATIGLVLLLLAGEPFNPTPAEWLGLLFFPVGICAGMIVAWWREGLGGSITVGSLVVFYMIHFATAGTLPRGWAWLVFAAPGFLFLLCWHRSRKARTVAA